MTQNTGTGTFYLHIQATDNAGNSSQTTSNGFVLDNTAPQTPELKASRTTPTNGDVFVYCTYSADSVIKEYKIGSGEWLSYPVSGYIRIASNTTVYARGTDAAGNVSPEADLLISNIVKTAPAIQFTPDGNSTAAKMHSTVVAATATSPAAINMLLYQWTKSASLPTAGTWTSLDSGDTLSWSSGDGLYYLHIKAFDDAGNVSSDSSSGFLLDNTAPDTPTLVASTSAPTNQDVTITITYPGDSVTNEYRVDNGAWTFYDSTEKVVVSGNCTVYARATDSAGNISTSNLIQITNIVKTPPVVMIVTNGNSDSEKVQSTIVNISVSDPAKVASSEFQWTMSSTFPTSGTWTTFASGETLSQSSGDGDFYVHVRVTDTAGNGTEISSNTFLLDNTAPTVTINQAESQDDPSNNETIYFTVVFSEPVTGFSNSDVTLTGTSGGTKAINVTGSGTTYTVSVTGMTDGTLVASLSEGVAADAADNTSTASTSTDNTVLYDITRPIVTINQAESQEDPSNNDTLYFDVVFSEPVTGFTNSDVTLSGTAGGRKTLLVTGSGTTYTVSVTGMTDGTVIASLAEGVAADAAGNTNAASTSTDNSILYDKTRPTVTINQAESQDDPSNNDTLYFTVVFSEEVTGLTADDITLSGTSGGTKTIHVTGNGTTYTVSVTGMTDGTVIASIAEGVAADAAGNTSTASTSTDHSILYDITRPTVTINQSESQDDPSNNETLYFTVVFSEEVAGLTAEDITFSGTAGGTKSVTVTDSGNHKLYTVSVSGMTDGTVIANLAEGVAADAAGNSSTASTSTDNSILYDNTRPIVTINQARGQADPSLTKPVYFTVVFSEPFSDFTSEDIYISGSANPRSVSISGSGLIYTVSVSGMTQTGSVKATVRAGAVYDAAGNTSLASTSLDNTVTYDTRVHAVTLATIETGGVRTTDLGLVVAIPEMWMTDTDMVEFWLESTEIRSITPETEYSYVSLARSRLYAAGYQLLTPYDIELMQRVYKSSGEMTISKVDNSHIRGNVTVLLPIPSELLGFSDLNIAFIDDSGAVAILDAGRVTIDGVEYLEFANNHFSVYAIISVADTDTLPPIPATSDDSSPKTSPFLATVYGIAILLLGLVLAWYRWMIRRRRDEESISG